MIRVHARRSIVRGIPAALAILGLLVALPHPAQSAGAWETHIRPKDFADLIVTDSTVWCATAEAGLLRFDRVQKTFTSVTREPATIASNHLTSLAFDRVGRLCEHRRQHEQRVARCGLERRDDAAAAQVAAAARAALLQPCDQRVHLRLCAAGHHLNAAVIKVARIARHPQRLSLPLSGIAKPYPLHHAIHIRSNANLCHNRPLNSVFVMALPCLCTAVSLFLS